MLELSSLIPDQETLTPSWQWQSWQGLPYLTCSLLKDWQHGFFSQHFSPRLPEDLVKILHPKAQAYRVKQVHGNRVLMPSEIEVTINVENSTTSLSPGDGILSEGVKEAVWVATADCTPVLMVDVKTGRVAAIHAGWRGTAQRIVPEAIARFVSFGSCLENLRIAMGPAITGEVYQVSEEVAAQVGSSLNLKEQTDTSEGIIEALQEVPNSPLSPDPQPGRVRLDVRRVNELQLQQLGISEKQVAIAPHCTYQQPEHFFSYRRTRQKKVQWSGIVSNLPSN
ncbi:MAG: peptidoglycan editing factor PgeF [Moorea sp. SIO2B7]|nr:peptidoglycan editing factor PgeF [Moorena sp. SIO2B7]